MINLLNIASWAMVGLIVINIGIQLHNFYKSMKQYSNNPHLEDAIAQRVTRFHAVAMKRLFAFMLTWVFLQFMIRLWPQI